MTQELCFRPQRTCWLQAGVSLELTHRTPSLTEPMVFLLWPLLGSHWFKLNFTLCVVESLTSVSWETGKLSCLLKKKKKKKKRKKSKGEAPHSVVWGRCWKWEDSVQANTAAESQLDQVPDRFSGQRVDPLSDKEAAHHPLRSSLAGSQPGRTMISSLLYLIISSYLLEARDAFNLVARVQEEAAAWWDSFFPISFLPFFIGWVSIPLVKGLGARSHLIITELLNWYSTILPPSHLSP